MAMQLFLNYNIFFVLEIFLLQNTPTTTRLISLRFIHFVVLFYVCHYFTSEDLKFTTSHIPLSLQYIFLSPVLRFVNLTYNVYLLFRSGISVA